jgi:predicted RNase H-like nuclease (RuvC/YqgF family)
MAYAALTTIRFGVPIGNSSKSWMRAHRKADEKHPLRKDKVMSDISALEGRIAQALDRIRQGVDAAEAAGPSDAALAKALETEREANAELVQRVSILKERQDTQVNTLTAKVETQRAQMQKLDAELQSLRASNVELREMNTRLREAVTEGLAPALHDEAVAAEINALHAQRTADAAELDAILTELKPLIAEGANATG